MPTLCKGFSERMQCVFSQTKIGAAARPRTDSKCLFCDPAKMAASCETVRGRQNITQSLKKFRAEYETKSHVYNAALMLVPEEWRQKFHEAAIKSKRGAPARPRNARREEQSTSVGSQWKEALLNRKRAFQALRSKEMTAYKKRRTADRNRVQKKFFLDNQLPPPAADDVAENDCGLPAACSSDRAGFVEQWCKFGSWGICSDCHSLQPRNLEPPDTRRVALSQITPKMCKQCKAKQWVPQPEEIPQPLRKLSLTMSKVLRPLDIDVGPVMKADSGYRHHVRMIRFSWSKTSVKDKIAEARETLMIKRTTQAR